VLEHAERDFAQMFLDFKNPAWDPCENNRAPMNIEAARSFKSCILTCISECTPT
jgi:hypothetical protein